MKIIIFVSKIKKIEVMRKVLKFGGTSVGSARNMRRVADIMEREDADLTVLSAMSGTTDGLQRAAQLASQGGHEEEIAGILGGLKDKYTECARELLDGEMCEAADKITEVFAFIADELAAYGGERSQKAVIAQGELLTTALFTMFLRREGRDAVLLHAPSFVRRHDDDTLDMQLMVGELARLSCGGGRRYVTQGFICSDSSGALDNLGRGGSDYSAALMGAAAGAAEVQIWTDIDGMHNNDPRFVEGTFPIRTMHFDEAAELAYFGAKILHPSTVQPCKDKGIAVLLKNTMDPDAAGTRISNDEQAGPVYRAVAAKDDIIVVRIHSARMLMAYGFLRRVFEIFERYRTPIDMITTSEVSVSLTVDSDCHLDDILRELAPLGSIEVERGNSIVCIVGRLDHGEHGLAVQIMEAAGDVPLKMISYGASHRSIVMLVDTGYKVKLLRNLNEKLFAGHV